MYVQDLRKDLRKSKMEFLFSSFEEGTLLVRKCDPDKFFMKIDETDEGNVVYLDNGKVFRVKPLELCSPVGYTFTIDS